MKVEIIVDRGDKIETVDVTSKFPGGMTTGMLAQIRQATKDAGRGDVLSARKTYTKSNEGQLRRAWNNLHNEGGYGYEPDFSAQETYQEWTEVEEVR